VRATVVVIGAGHSGLAISRRLTERSIDHVVIERGEVANSWRTERWDSLRLLTPNWLNRLPGMPYCGDEPDGFMTATQLARHIGDYAMAIEAPVNAHTTVTRVGATSTGYEVETDHDRWQCAAVVIASGPCNRANLPACAESLPATVAVHTPMSYRSPSQLDEGGVLVVGASASGVQLAEEIHRSGRAVTLAVGEHVRMPRTYRGRDIFWWTDAVTLDDRYDEVDDLVRARALPSPQLIGSSDRRSVDLGSLHRQGITIVGRLGRISGSIAQFSGSLRNTCALADLKLNRLLERFDRWAEGAGADVDPPHRFRPTEIARCDLELDLRRAGITTALFATGFRPEYPWLDLPVLDRRGRLVHDGGVVTDAPGCYVVGLNLLRRRRSSYVSGAEQDSADIARHVHRHLDTLVERRASPSGAGSANRGVAGVSSADSSSMPNAGGTRSESSIACL
jgi:putative flavoprotein involved in K+ transport